MMYLQKTVQGGLGARDERAHQGEPLGDGESTLPHGGFAGRARRAAEVGVTLVEVMIVVAIMALLASGVAIAILPRYKEAQVSTAKTNAQVLRRSVQDWQRVNMEETCPTVSQLVEGKHLDSATTRDDPWGMEWTLVCADEDVFVQSMGPDKKPGTEDDISVPKLRADLEN